jgi:hypothetical protein
MLSDSQNLEKTQREQYFGGEIQKKISPKNEKSSRQIPGNYW